MQFGEFDIDPDSIPAPTKVTLGTPLVFEVESAVRKEVVKEETGKTVYIEAVLIPVEQPDTRLYNTWFVTERYVGSAAKSWKNFLLTVGLDPKITKAQDIVHLRFKGIAGVDTKRDDERPVLKKVLGAAY